MSLLSVVRDVALAVGVKPQTSMFSASIEPRTQAELLSLANEMAQRIAWDVREWTKMKAFCTFVGPGTVDPFNTSHFTMPADFRRMLLTAQVYPSWMPTAALTYINDTDVWLQNRLRNFQQVYGEWTLLGDEMLIHPALGIDPVTLVPQAVTFAYLTNRCVKLNAGGYGTEFKEDADEFRLNERLLKLGMIWQWKANKGSPYAEDMGTYTDALFMLAGSDKPSPIIIDHQPMYLPPVAANVAISR